MKRRTLLVTALLLAFGTRVDAQLPDFNGVWQLDESASEITTGDGLAGLGTHAPPTLYITQRRDGSIIIASRLTGSEPRAYQIGGDTWVEPPPPGEREFLIRSRVRGLSLVSEGSGEVDGEIVSIREVLTMGRNGSRISLEVTTTRSYGPETNKLVYNRSGGGGTR